MVALNGAAWRRLLNGKGAFLRDGYEAMSAVG